MERAGERKPDADVVEMAAPPIVEAAEFEAVQALLKSRSPALTAPRVGSGPTLLTGICFCAACGKAMTLRTGKGGRYRYYTCSTKGPPGRDRVLLRTLVAASSVKTAAFGVPSFVSEVARHGRFEL